MPNLRKRSKRRRIYLKMRNQRKKREARNLSLKNIKRAKIRKRRIRKRKRIKIDLTGMRTWKCQIVI